MCDCAISSQGISSNERAYVLTAVIFAINDVVLKHLYCGDGMAVAG